MVSVRLPLFDSEPGMRRNRTWDETQPNLGRGTTEPGTWHDRTWDETQPNLGRGTTEPGTWHDRTWDETQPNLGRRSLASLVDGLSGRRQRCCDGWKCFWFPVAS